MVDMGHPASFQRAIRSGIMDIAGESLNIGRQALCSPLYLFSILPAESLWECDPKALQTKGKSWFVHTGSSIFARLTGVVGQGPTLRL